MNQPDPAHQPNRTRRRKIVIIGAGMSGMLVAIRLQQAGITDFEILEKAASAGGTWRDNTYPGLACDVPGYLYTYSFEPNPECSHRYAHGDEIQAYFLRVFEKYGLRQYVRFNQEVDAAEYDQHRWRITTKSGEQIEADILISAVGVLHQPNYPDIPGLDRFRGDLFHSARWDHNAPLQGKRVVVIGTGSTAVQIVCGLVDQVARLKLFQRTAQWVLPAFDTPYAEWPKWIMRRLPFTAKWLHQRYDDLYHGILGGGFGKERVLFINTFRLIAERHLRTVQDPDLRRRLTPDFPFGCKRFILSDGFYKAMQQPQTELVTDGIEGIEENGIRTRDGTLHEVDVIVLATGFKAQNYVRPIKLVGEQGITLDQYWADGLKAYKTMALPGFPNFFMVQGPHSPIGNFSLIKIAEMQCDYLLQLVQHIVAGQAASLAPKATATDAYNAELQRHAQNTLWMGNGCQSWYIDSRGRLTIWPLSIGRFQALMKQPKWEDFEISIARSKRRV
ncbi:flavin-containing monooxygenase [Ketobacter sp.]|uniref:flavin-containing monooxygenase n=1 Tax=Ketobacter sp. TaxID=2083498 RepID=UPI000F1D8B62|nr:NAD(P)/FAD-dependent oxidoreductase [Ketobacter sp.]RLU01170.1 MAG: NAD(P)/FAD-dependent oxidoreductase [Ketobacter sp.]